MKKHLFILTAFFLIFFTHFSLFAQNLQLVMPKIIYIGDLVDIRYVFHSETNLFGGDFENSNASMELSTDYEFFSSNQNDFTLKSARLEKNSSEYTLFLTVIPWKTGFLKISPFNLTSYVQFSRQTRETNTVPFVVSLSPVEVKSLVAKTENKNFLPHKGPVTLPGTTLLLLGLSCLALTVFALLIYVLLHMPKIARFIDNLLYLYSLKKNSRKTIRRLTELKKESVLSDKETASRMQHILRTFLTNRFKTDFSSIASTKFYQFFNELLGGNLNTHQENTIEGLTSLFNRLDYIRYSKDSVFILTDNGESEKILLIDTAILLVEQFDSEEEE